MGIVGRSPSELARAAGRDAAERQRRAAGRAAWSAEDFALAARTMNEACEICQQPILADEPTTDDGSEIAHTACVAAWWQRNFGAPRISDERARVHAMQAACPDGVSRPYTLSGDVATVITPSGKPVTGTVSAGKFRPDVQHHAAHRMWYPAPAPPARR